MTIIQFVAVVVAVFIFFQIHERYFQEYQLRYDLNVALLMIPSIKPLYLFLTQCCAVCDEQCENNSKDLHSCKTGEPVDIMTMDGHNLKDMKLYNK